MNGVGLGMEEPRPVQFAQDREDAAGSVHVLDVIRAAGREGFRRLASGEGRRWVA